MALRYFKADELPSWVGTVTVNGTAPDLSSGYTFRVTVSTDLDATATVTKTTGITGASGGVFTVAWATDELDIATGNYVACCTATRTSDSAQWTVSEPLVIMARP